KQSYKVTQYRWGDDAATKVAAKALGQAFSDFVATGSEPRSILEDWQTHRYPLALNIASGAAEAWRAERKRAGHLNFQDLLMEAAELLRSSPAARRQLGGRYRRLLVDEFQDTDPVQAEVLMLLASEPDERREPSLPWTDITPRPGALFVVGDPKQSIYRFRRADITVYSMVKERFEAFGAVLVLQANFRSREAIGDLVNAVFQSEDHFGPEATPHQAEFAPLLTQPKDDSAPAEGVFHYYSSDASTAGDLIAEDAAMLGSWIRRRCGPGGDRSPRDFLVLTRHRAELAVYAQALEGRGLPVAVSGAGVGSERETQELILLLEALADPGNPVKTIAVLVGLFFGLDHQQLWDHRDAGGTFSLTHTFGQPETPVTLALQRVNRWWEATRREPADIFVGRILDDLGLLPYAASGTLGQLRAGSLVFALDAIRSAALDGDTSLRGALETLANAFESAEVEAPLEPVRPNAIRLMNLHKAKGLEAPVVILAASRKLRYRPPTQHFERQAGAGAKGYVVIDEKSGHTRITHAQPPDWPRRREEERLFLEAEEVRLMYVAATRAADELIIARRQDRPQASPWSIFDDWLDAHGRLLEDMPVEPLTPPAVLDRDGADIVAEIREVERDRGKRGRIGYEFLSVTSLTKATRDREDQLTLEFPAGGVSTTDRSRGFPWGTVVHGALAAAARGLDTDSLRAACRALLVENERPQDPDGEPTELVELLELLAAVRASTLWQRAEAADRLLVETPFSVELSSFETGDSVRPTSGGDKGRTRYVEGVIDLAFREAGSWIIADYKTDVGTDPQFAIRTEDYKRQVELYAACWESLTGEPVKERILLYTSQHRQEVW
ncbi:MAG: UvrD-helicase domain-containing protein, partial [Longimicrobiales bacterium]